MSTPDEGPGEVEEAMGVVQEARRRRSAVFGDDDDAASSDERDPADRVDPATERDENQQWFEEQVPPHHGV